MKYLFAIFVLTGIVLQSASKLTILMSFTLNRAYIAKNLCVQKKVKNNCCKGSCHLAKELKNEEKKEQVPGNSLKSKSETLLFFQTIALNGLGNQSPGDIPLITLAEPKAISHSFPIFHPPCGTTTQRG